MKALITTLVALGLGTAQAATMPDYYCDMELSGINSQKRALNSEMQSINWRVQSLNNLDSQIAMANNSYYRNVSYVNSLISSYNMQLQSYKFAVSMYNTNLDRLNLKVRNYNLNCVD